MDPRFHMGIPIWKLGLTHPHIEMVHHCFVRGLKSSGSPFLYGNHCMETGIDVSPFPHGDCLLPYGNSKLMDPRFHMGIPI